MTRSRTAEKILTKKEGKTAIKLLKFLAKNKEYLPQNGIDAALADCEVKNIMEGEGNDLYKKLYPKTHRR